MKRKYSTCISVDTVFFNNKLLRPRDIMKVLVPTILPTATPYEFCARKQNDIIEHLHEAKCKQRYYLGTNRALIPFLS